MNKGRFSIKELPGVDSTTAEKLREAGYDSVESIAIASPLELKEIAGISEGMALKIIQAARKIASIGIFTSATEYKKRLEATDKISTGSANLDSILKGGIWTGVITEILGEPNSGRTPFAYALSVMVQLPPERGGLNGSVIWIDTENSFNHYPLEEIARNKGLNPEEILKNIYVARAFNSDHQVFLVEKAGELIEEKAKTKNPVKLLVVDSIPAHFRVEYIGRGDLAGRQQKLGKHLADLRRIAELYNVAVIIINDMRNGNPWGGHILEHASMFRLQILKRGRGNSDKRIVRLIKSPYFERSEVTFRITERGVED